MTNSKRKSKRTKNSTATDQPKVSRPPSAYTTVIRDNAQFEHYYKTQNILPDMSEWSSFMDSLKASLPTTFRFTGSSAYAKSLADHCRTHYFKQMHTVDLNETVIHPPKPIAWYPNDLAYQYSVDRPTIRRVPAFTAFHQFLTAECDIGNLSRQEAVSMVPPLLLDVHPHHRVLDMCAAPGSKTAQLIEAVHANTTSNDPNGGLPEGLVVANDADFKRAYMLVHQTKRLQSPCLLVTNHEAQYFPHIYDPSSKQPILYDRILCDVPCSGDGTLRKNFSIWNDWGIGQPLALHILQLRILMRAVALTKVGGRIVYSTCSFNPIENEAVVAAALARCNGALSLVKASLPNLKHAPGLSSWKVPSFKDKGESFYDHYSSVAYHDKVRIVPSMFPPSSDNSISLNLDWCLRIYPHYQDTGGFFVAVLHKVAQPDLSGRTQFGELPEDFPMKRGRTPNSKPGFVNKHSSVHDNQLGQEVDCSTEPDENVPDLPSVDAEPIIDQVSDLSISMPTLSPIPDQIPLADSKSDKAHTQRTCHHNFASREEPIIYLDKSDKEVQRISITFGISNMFPVTQLCVRSELESHRAIYFTSASVKQTLLANNAHRINVINTGVKLLTRRSDLANVTDKSDCTHRFNSIGLALVGPMLTKRVIQLDLHTFKTLLMSDRPLLSTLPCPKLVHALSALPVGPAVCKLIDLNGTGQVLYFSLWKAAVSAGLLICKKERLSLLTRMGVHEVVEVAGGNDLIQDVADCV